jgi:hypothetical protein
MMNRALEKTADRKGVPSYIQRNRDQKRESEVDKTAVTGQTKIGAQTRWKLFAESAAAPCAIAVQAGLPL